MDNFKKDELLERIWKETPSDYKSMYDNEKCILVFRKKGTCLVRLADLTDKEIGQHSLKKQNLNPQYI